MGISIAERIESLKAGILAGGVFAVTYLGIVLVNRLLLLPQFPELGQIPANIWVNLAIAPVSGFLFGVTYRYIIITRFTLDLALSRLWLQPFR